MLIDTHCHINMMVKKKFDIPLTETELHAAETIIKEAKKHGVEIIITVGTSLIESQNCVQLAKRYPELYATVGIHPNDCTATWKEDLKAIKEVLKKKGKIKSSVLVNADLIFIGQITIFNVKKMHLKLK